MNKIFPTYEIGSLPKLPARVKALSATGTVTEEDVQAISEWGKTTQVETTHAIDVLKKRRKGEVLTPEDRTVLIDFNALLNIQLQQQAGLDVVYDGEARRIEMYEHIARQIDGFEALQEPLRSRGPDSWRAFKCKTEPQRKGRLEELPIVREFQFVVAHATALVKIPIDDPYMIANMTINEHYKKSLQQAYENNPRGLRYEAKRALTLALARNVIRPQVEAAIQQGAQWIQLDIPSATIDLEHIPIMVEGINAVVAGLDDVKGSLHVCYPKRKTLASKQGYDLLFPHILSLDRKIDHISLELANANLYEQDLAAFARYQAERRFEIGLGVVDITLERLQQGLIETPELVRDRILTAAKVLGDPTLVYVAPDCGLRQVSLERAVQLYKIMVQGAELARKAI